MNEEITSHPIVVVQIKMAPIETKLSVIIRKYDFAGVGVAFEVSETITRPSGSLSPPAPCGSRCL